MMRNGLQVGPPDDPFGLALSLFWVHGVGGIRTHETLLRNTICRPLTHVSQSLHRYSGASLGETERPGVTRSDVVDGDHVRTAIGERHRMAGLRASSGRIEKPAVGTQNPALNRFAAGVVQRIKPRSELRAGRLDAWTLSVVHCSGP